MLMAYRAYEFAKSLSLTNYLENHAYTRLHGAGWRFPIPPAHLRVLVSGTSKLEWFLEFGKRTADEIINVMKKNGVDIDRFESVLEFGCGCGRIIRHWDTWRGVAVSGTDYNSTLVRWCEQSLPFAKFSVNESAPPLKYGDEQFDFIYAISVFTHMPEQAQYAWMGELRRILRPGGYALLTVRGDAYRSQLTACELERFVSGGFVVRHPRLFGSNLCNCFHPESFVRGRFAEGFEIIDYLPAHENLKPRPVSVALHPRQDAVILRKMGSR